MPTRTILLAVDLQRDFLDGALVVPGATSVLPLIDEVKGSFDLVYLTLDWHPLDHCSFKERGGGWPRHCVQHTQGASIPESVFNGLDRERIRFILKGSDPAREEYGVLTGVKAAEQDYFQAGDEVVICGIASEFCVLNTLIDVHRLSKEVGFTVKVFLPGTAKFESHDSLLKFAAAEGISFYQASPLK